MLSGYDVGSGNQIDPDGTKQGEVDPVGAPPHYTRLSPQPIDVMEAWGLDFHSCQVIKYLARAGYKGDRLTDLRKARFYLDRAISKAERER